MRLLLASLLSTVVTASAHATVLPGGLQTSADENHSISVSDAAVVGVLPSGNQLLAVTLTLNNQNGDPRFNIRGVEFEIGLNGSLHNEQVGGFSDFRAPLAETWLNGPTSSLSTVDSYILPSTEGGTLLDAPAEGVLTDDAGILEQLSGAPNASAGFGAALTGNYILAGSFETLDVAYLTFENRGGSTAIDFRLQPSDDSGSISSGLQGCIGFCKIPEPSTALITSLALVGVTARRNERSKSPLR